MNNKCEKKLKIAMIGQKRIPSREGGVEIVVENIATRMVKTGHIVHAYNRKGKHVLNSEVECTGKNITNHKGVTLIPVFTIDKKGLAALSSSIVATIKAVFNKYDIIHFHAEGPSAMLWLPKILGIKTVVTIHGLDWQRNKWGNLASKYIKLGEWMAAKYADEVIVLSKNIQKYFKDVYDRNTKFIPNGIEKNDLIEIDEIDKLWGIKKNEYILYLGRIVPEKGLTYLIDAYKKIKTAKKLVIAGGASDTNTFFEEIKEMCQNDDRIIFTGFVEGKVLSELYSNAYIYVLPSDVEGMPISLLEAMSFGNCCVVSDISECVEVVEDKAIIFEKGNVLDLKIKLEHLIKNKSIVEKYKEQSSLFICKKYKWDDVVDKTLCVYKEVVEKG